MKLGLRLRVGLRLRLGVKLRLGLNKSMLPRKGQTLLFRSGGVGGRGEWVGWVVEDLESKAISASNLVEVEVES